MSAPSISGLSVELLLRVIDVKYGYFTLLFTSQILVRCFAFRPPGQSSVLRLLEGRLLWHGGRNAKQRTVSSTSLHHSQ